MMRTHQRTVYAREREGGRESFGNREGRGWGGGCKLLIAGKQQIER